MSNLGLERFLAGQGLAMHRTQVGDRYVAERMREAGMNVGGEQSGHVILSDFATTGDGLLAALQVLAVMVEQRTFGARGLPRVHAAAATAEERALRRRLAVAQQARSSSAIAAAEAELNGSGRLLIRESGTEPLIRVMAEGEDEALVGAHGRRAVRDDRGGLLGSVLQQIGHHPLQVAQRVAHGDHVADRARSGTCRNRRCPRRNGYSGFSQMIRFARCDSALHDLGARIGAVAARVAQDDDRRLVG